MNADVKQQWVAALRSGEYRQGKGKLALADGTYCCLGVLCELAIKAGVDVRKEDSNLDGACFTYDNWDGLLPPSVRDWAGLGSSVPSVTAPGFIGEALTTINDGLELPFNEIADLIEAQL